MLKKSMPGLVLFAVLAFAAPAPAQPIVAVTDPTSDGSTGLLTGQYTDLECTTDPNTGEETCEEVQRTQVGYVGVYEDGVVVCNGNPNIVPAGEVDPVLGEIAADLLVGYAWVGSPDFRPSTDRMSVPFFPVAGYGRNDKKAGTGEPSGNSPCPDANPKGIN